MKVHVCSIRMGLLFLAMVSIGPLVGSALRADAPKINKDKLVGTWVVAKGEFPKDATLKFTKDGKVTVVRKQEGKTVTVKGTYELDGDQLKSTITTPDGEERMHTGTIKKLTDKELVMETENGQTVEFKKK